MTDDIDHSDLVRDRALWLQQLANLERNIYVGPERRSPPPHETCLMAHIELTERIRQEAKERELAFLRELTKLKDAQRESEAKLHEWETSGRMVRWMVLLMLGAVPAVIGTIEWWNKNVKL